MCSNLARITLRQEGFQEAYVLHLAICQLVKAVARATDVVIDRLGASIPWG